MTRSLIAPLPRPDIDVQSLVGRSVALERVDPACRDAAGLWQSIGAHKELWAGTPAGPFADAATFTTWLGERVQRPGTALYAIIDLRGDQPAAAGLYFLLADCPPAWDRGARPGLRPRAQQTAPRHRSVPSYRGVPAGHPSTAASSGAATSTTKRPGAPPNALGSIRKGSCARTCGSRGRTGYRRLLDPGYRVAGPARAPASVARPGELYRRGPSDKAAREPLMQPAPAG